jgi:hypothetical protein
MSQLSHIVDVMGKELGTSGRHADFVFEPRLQRTRNTSPTECVAETCNRVSHIIKRYEWRCSKARQTSVCQEGCSPHPMMHSKFLKSDDELPTHKLMLGRTNLMKRRLLASTSCMIAGCLLRYSRNDDKG